MKTILEAKGRVQWWLYTVGHRQLLLRRPKDTEHPRRLEVLFVDVAEVHMVAHFDNLRVLEVEPGDEELPRASAEGRKVFRLVGDNAVGHIVAGGIAHAEDDLEYNDPSSLFT